MTFTAYRFGEGLKFHRGVFPPAPVDYNSECATYRFEKAVMDDDKDSMPGVLWGAKAIAAYIRQTPRQTYYLLESGQLPAQKLGAKWVAVKSRIRAHLSGQTLQ